MSRSGVETLNDLIEWTRKNFPGATVEEGEGGVIIRTGLESSMGGYLHPIEREGESGYECQECELTYTLSPDRIKKESPQHDSFVCDLCEEE